MQVAVVGAGRWGGLHAAKLAALPGVRLAAVVDAEPARAQALAARHPGARPLERVAQLPPAIVAATVAVDLPNLADVTRALLARGLHVLVEKPMAPDAATAQALVAVAEARDRVLAVGFLERFNPALAAGPRAPRRVVARRVGPPRCAAPPLDLDWLVHDLDLAAHLLGDALQVVRARWAEDAVRLVLRSEDGREARLCAARRAVTTRRRLWADGARVDLCGAGDPLAAQLAAFVGAARGASLGRLATGADAVRALALLDAARALGRAAAA